MKNWALISLSLALSSCTVSITTIHTQGTASDVVDEDQKADAQVSPDISFPALGYDYSMSGRDVGLV